MKLTRSQFARLNKRRYELIRWKHEFGLSPGEEEDLEILQMVAAAYVEDIAPLPSLRKLNALAKKALGRQGKTTACG